MQMSAIFNVIVWASSISMMALAIAPGPQSIGIASGVMEISFMYVFTSSSLSLALE